jgi:general stress protein 26
MAKHLKDTEPGDRRKVGELIRAIRVAFLTTVDHDGRFHAGPVQTLQVDADETLWFFTDWSSPKVDELHRDVRVSLGYADPAPSFNWHSSCVSIVRRRQSGARRYGTGCSRRGVDGKFGGFRVWHGYCCNYIV